MAWCTWGSCRGSLLESVQNSQHARAGATVPAWGPHRRPCAAMPHSELHRRMSSSPIVEFVPPPPPVHSCPACRLASQVELFLRLLPTVECKWATMRDACIEVLRKYPQERSEDDIDDEEEGQEDNQEEDGQEGD
eukprot:148867-Pyramimonas_sp.AAC.1